MNNGIDLWTKNGTPCYSAHKGIVTWAGKGSDGGIGIVIWNPQNLYKTIYYHLKETLVKINQEVEAGELIGFCDNTGKYTTGDHLHFGLKETNDAGATTNWDNGYKGAIDPAPYFPKNWDKPPVWSGYKQIHLGWNGRNWRKELYGKIALKRQLGRKPAYLEVMAHVYGDWNAEDIRNTNMRYAWMYMTKKQFLQGEELQIPVKYSINY